MSQLASSREQFDAWVHDALAHLYDTVHLQRHPLAELLAPSAELGQRASAVRRVVIEAIQTLRPAPGVPASSHEWRGHRILELRYLEGLSPAEAIESLHLSRSQFFREQQRVVQALCDLLFEKMQAAAVAAAIPEQPDLVADALGRFADQAALSDVDAAELLDGLAPMLRNLSRATQLDITIESIAAPITFRADATLLRQAMLSIASQVVRLEAPARLRLGAWERDVTRCLSATVSGLGRAILAELATQMETAEQLARACGARFATETLSQTMLSINLLWTTRPQLLFVIDDNPQFAELYRRYLASLPWSVVSATCSAQALDLLASLDHPPDAILLDMLMPGEDGWQVLAQLRELPALGETPVFICSVLDQPELAKAMGAQGTLRKPVEQAALVEALAGV